MDVLCAFCVCVQRLKRLADLEEQVRVLSSQGRSDSVGSVVSVGSSLDIEDHKLQLQRMKEVFRKKFAQFRDGVYMLTGFKVSYAPAAGQ